MTLVLLAPMCNASLQVVYTWTQLSSSLPFVLVENTNAAVYDSESDVLLYFDKRDGKNYSMLTWVYNHTLGSWTKLSSSGFVRQAAAVAYDRESDRVILFGGHKYRGGGFVPGGFLSDTWAYDYNSDTWTNMTVNMTGASPPPRAWVDMTYDVESDRIILFGGREIVRAFPLNYPVTRNDTWAYDYNSNSWEKMTPPDQPKPGWAHGLAYDIESDRVILHGGMNDKFTHNETWAYDYNTDRWTKMIAGAGPGSRDQVSLDYNAITDQCILFGGLNTGGNIARTGSETPFDDMWIYDYNTNTWMEVDLYGSPDARSGHEMVYDPKEDLIILMGGSGDDIQVNDMWIFGYEIVSNIPTKDSTDSTTHTQTSPLVISPLFLSIIVPIIVNRRRK